MLVRKSNKNEDITNTLLRKKDRVKMIAIFINRLIELLKGLIKNYRGLNPMFDIAS